MKEKKDKVLPYEGGQGTEQRVMALFAQETGAEEASLRDRNIKHFNLGAGRYQAVTYSEPVHYLEPVTGKWMDIDNNLELRSDASGVPMLRNRASDVRFAFPVSADGNALAHIETEGRSFSWGLERPPLPVSATVRSGAEIKRLQLGNFYREAVKDGQAVPLEEWRAETAKRLSPEEAAAREAEIRRLPEGEITSSEAYDIEREFFSPEDIRLNRIEYASEVEYDQVLPGVSMRYLLSGPSVKEDIIIDSPSALESASLRLNGDYAFTREDNNAVRVQDKASGETIFLMRVPVAWDSSEEAEKIYPQVELTPCNGYTRLRFAFDTDYLAKAVFPITIDPVVMTEHSYEDVYDTYFRSDMTSTNFGTDTVMVAGVYGTPQYVSLMRFNKLIKQRASDTILSAQLRLSPYDKYKASTCYIGAYEILRSWAPNTATGAISRRTTRPTSAGSCSLIFPLRMPTTSSLP